MQDEHQVVEGDDEVELLGDGAEQLGNGRMARDSSRHAQKAFVPRDRVEAG